jgi:hypothetical protein
MNLQMACHVSVILEPLESFTITQQCIGRIARRGQTKMPYVFIYSTSETYDEVVEGLAEDKALQTVISTADLPYDPDSPVVQSIVKGRRHDRYFPDVLTAAQTYLAEDLYTFATGHEHTMRWWSKFMKDPDMLAKTKNGYPVGRDSYVDEAATPRPRRDKTKDSIQRHSLSSGFTRRVTDQLGSPPLSPIPATGLAPVLADADTSCPSPSDSKYLGKSTRVNF